MEKVIQPEGQDDSLGDIVLIELCLSLQLLVAQAQDQIAHFSPILIPICKEDDMALEYDHWSNCVHAYWKLSQDQVEKLTTLNHYLANLSGQSQAAFWTDEALFTDPRWGKVRSLAKMALASFQWPIEVPPLEQHPERYVPSSHRSP
jgi:hypothetical protein